MADTISTMENKAEEVGAEVKEKAQDLAAR